MLAKECKIRSIMRQRKFLEDALKNAAANRDGDPSYAYVGYMYPENIKHLECEGFKVTITITGPALLASKGFPIYHITISDNLTLSEEEAKEAEKYEEAPFEEECEECGGMPILAALMGMSPGGSI